MLIILITYFCVFIRKYRVVSVGCWTVSRRDDKQQTTPLLVSVSGHHNQLPAVVFHSNCVTFLSSPYQINSQSSPAAKHYTENKFEINARRLFLKTRLWKHVHFEDVSDWHENPWVIESDSVLGWVGWSNQRLNSVDRGDVPFIFSPIIGWTRFPPCKSTFYGRPLLCLEELVGSQCVPVGMCEKREHVKWRE